MCDSSKALEDLTLYLSFISKFIYRLSEYRNSDALPIRILGSKLPLCDMKVEPTVQNQKRKAAESSVCL